MRRLSVKARVFKLPMTLALLATCWLWPQRAVAAPFTYNFTATVYSVDAQLTSAFFLGQSVTGSVTLNPAVPDVWLTPIGGFYPWSVVNFGVDIGSYAVSSTAGHVYTSNNDPDDRFEIYTGNGYPTGPSVGSLNLSEARLIFQDTTATHMSTDAFVQQIVVGDWTSATGYLSFAPSTGSGDYRVRFALDSEPAPGASPVPEPVSLALVGSGAAALVSARRRQRRQSTES